MLLLTGWSAAVAIEEPAYEVVGSYDGFELRRYAPYLVAETDVEAGFSDAGNAAFRTLFRYIQGANRKAESIAMTAPVTQEPSVKGEKIEMTAPVTQAPDAQKGDRHVVAFVMPSSYTLDTLPRPTDPRVRIREVRERLVAVRRYSGSWREEKYREHEKALLDAVAREGLVPVSAPTFARYNSPFALWFMRRNEVWVEVAE